MVRAIVGANWGDEGKGKLTDMLAEKSDIVVRFQGGANAGHTIVNHYGKFALHTLPSGVFYDHTTNIIGNGVALNIPVFFILFVIDGRRGVDVPVFLKILYELLPVPGWFGQKHKAYEAACLLILSLFLFLLSKAK